MKVGTLDVYETFGNVSDRTRTLFELPASGDWYSLH